MPSLYTTTTHPRPRPSLHNTLPLHPTRLSPQRQPPPPNTFTYLGAGTPVAGGGTCHLQGIAQAGVGVGVGVEGPWVASFLVMISNVSGNQLAARICGTHMEVMEHLIK